MLSVQNVTVSTDSDGKASTNEDTFVQHLLLKPEQYQSLEKHFAAGGGKSLGYDQSAWDTGHQGDATDQSDADDSSPFGGGSSGFPGNPS